MVLVFIVMRFWFPLFPDLHKPIGGVKQVHRVVEHLNSLGFQSTIIQDSADFHPGWFISQVPTISLNDFKNLKFLDINVDYIVLPETFVSLIPRFFPGFPKIIFNQNGSYTFGLPGSKISPQSVASIFNLYRHKDVKHVLCVSDYDQHFLLSCLRLKPSFVTKLINAFETNIFCSVLPKERLITYMPRKNIDHSILAGSLLNFDPSLTSSWRLQPLHGFSQSKVANFLQRSPLFLSFGHPEGFGLPLIEAGGCGCFLLGYSGLGGKEIFSLGSRFGMSSEIDYGDIASFVSMTQKFVREFELRPLGLSESANLFSSALCSKYSPASMRASVEYFLKRLFYRC